MNDSNRIPVRCQLKRLPGLRFLLPVALYACSGERPAGVPVAPDLEPVRVRAISGDAQSSTVGELLTGPIRVRVTNRRGEPIAGVRVVFDSATGAGSADPADVRTGTDGVAATTWRLGLTAGFQRLVARVPEIDSVQTSIAALATPIPAIEIASGGVSVPLAGGRAHLTVAAGSGGVTPVSITFNDTSAVAREFGYPEFSVRPALSSLGRPVEVTLQPLPRVVRGNSGAVGRVTASGMAELVPFWEDAATGMAHISNVALHPPFPGADLTPPVLARASASSAEERYLFVNPTLERRRTWTVRLADPPEGLSIDTTSDPFPVRTLREVTLEVLTEWNRLLSDDEIAAPLRLVDEDADITIQFAPLDPGKGGVTEFCWSLLCSERVKRSITINSNLVWAPLAAQNRVSFALALRHELGHAIGLRHFNHGYCDFQARLGGDLTPCGIGEHVMAFVNDPKVPDPPLSCGDVDMFRRRYGVTVANKPTCVDAIALSASPPTQALPYGSDLRPWLNATLTDKAGRAIEGVSGTLKSVSPSGSVRLHRATSDASGRLVVPGELLRAEESGEWRLAAYLGRQTVIDTRSVTVVSRPPGILDLAVSPQTVSITVGGSMTVLATVTQPTSAPAASLVFTSSNSSVATIVSQGDRVVVRGAAPGTATLGISASAPGSDQFSPARLERQVAVTVSALPQTDHLGIGFGPEQFVLIAAGSFQMGSTTGNPDERPRRTVTISRPYRMQRTEVTQSQWRSIMGTSPSYFNSCGERCPVEYVPWSSIQVFLQRLNQQDPGKNYRLPTEAEWEYAARAGTTGAVAEPGVLSDLGWTFENSGFLTHTVAQKLPNAWGLYDVHGNVFEWVSDWYQADFYATGASIDPTGPASGTARVLRGGSWGYGAYNARLSQRWYHPPGFWCNDGGFRLVRNP